MRTGEASRQTKETRIRVKVCVDGTGKCSVKSGIGFLDHLLETFSRFSFIDLEAEIEGDLHVDQHHTVEDAGIVLGQALKQALGDKKGINRNGHCVFPMDEALVMCAVDISGRPYSLVDLKFVNEKSGDFQVDLVFDFFQALANATGLNLHVREFSGRSDHHKIEAAFKAFGRAMKQACGTDKRIGGKVLSTKGSLE